MYGLLLAVQIFLLFTTNTYGFDVPEELKEVIESLHNACVAESGVAEALIAAAQKGDFAEDQTLKCYMKCLMDNMGVLTDDGKIDVDAVLAIFPADLASQVGDLIRTCDTQMGVDVCDNVFQTQKCYYKGNPEGLSDEMQEVIQNLHNTCRDEIGVSEEMIADAQKGRFAEDQKLKCYMKCLLEQMACVNM